MEAKIKTFDEDQDETKDKDGLILGLIIRRSFSVLVKEKTCSMVIDGGNCTNLASNSLCFSDKE